MDNCNSKILNQTVLCACLKNSLGLEDLRWSKYLTSSKYQILHPSLGFLYTKDSVYRVSIFCRVLSLVETVLAYFFCLSKVWSPNFGVSHIKENPREDQNFGYSFEIPKSLAWIKFWMNDTNGWIHRSEENTFISICWRKNLFFSERKLLVSAVYHGKGEELFLQLRKVLLGFGNFCFCKENRWYIKEAR